MEKFSKIIVTGADGWLGMRLLERLAKESKKKDSIYYKNEIIAFVQADTLKKKFKELEIKVIVGDLRNEEDINKLLQNSEEALVFNLAGIIHPNFLSQRDFNKVNHLAMTSFANKSAKKGIKKFVAMSSNSPCGYSKNTLTRFDENSKYSPYMGYGSSKMKMEKNIILLSAQTKKTNFSIVRSPWFYGPHQPHRQTQFFSLIKNGSFPLVGEGKSMRSMGYIDNLVEGLILVSQYFDTNGEIFWISDRDPYSFYEIVMTVKKLLSNEFGFKIIDRQIYLPSIVSDIARYSDYVFQKLGIYFQKVHVLSEMNQTIACDINKAENLLGYAPKIKLEEGMRRSIKWCIDNGRKI